MIIFSKTRLASALLIVLMSSMNTYALSPAPINLGTASDFAILASTTITNIGASTVTGDIGLSPGSSITGFLPGILVGTQHISDASAT